MKWKYCLIFVSLYWLGCGGGGTGDSVPPIVSISSPSDGQEVFGPVTITVNALDNGGIVTKVEFFVNGQKVGEDTSAPFSYDWDVRSLSSGEYILTAKAQDSRGNQTSSTAVKVKVTIDSEPPDTQITGSPSAFSNQWLTSFYFRSTEPLATFECKLDDGDWENCPGFKNYYGLPEGTHHFEVRSRDKAGNLDPSPASYDWRIDFTPPDTSLNPDFSPPPLTNSVEYTFEFAGTDDVTQGANLKFQCAWMRGIWGIGMEEPIWGEPQWEPEPCSSPFYHSILEAGEPLDGPQRFIVRSVDEAGNVDPSPPSYTWFADTTPPFTELLDSGIHFEPGFPASNRNEATVIFTGRDNYSPPEKLTFVCFASGFPIDTDCKSPKHYTNIPEGPWGYEIYAIDEAGNQEFIPYVGVVAEEFDYSVPETFIVSGPPNPTEQTSAVFDIDGYDTWLDSYIIVRAWECMLEGEGFDAGWEFCDLTPPTREHPYYSYSIPGPLNPGIYTFRVRAVDWAGNRDPTPAEWQWEVIPPP